MKSLLSLFLVHFYMDFEIPCIIWTQIVPLWFWSEFIKYVSEEKSVALYKF